jgi:predicted HicB family RNase H-like nuclease
MDKKPSETRVNVWIEPELYQKIKAGAALGGITLKEFVTEALKEKLKKKSQPR